MSSHHYVACDFGAESCRVMLGTLTDDQLVVEEVHRFVNAPVTLLGTLRWDVIGIFDELKIGLHKAAIRGHRIESMSTDSWGVDYVYVRAQEPLLTLPYHYLDRRTDGLLEKAFATVPGELIYSETGIQFLQLNTLYQLLADLEHRREILEFSDQFLSIADYFNYLFCGAACAEESIASTTRLFNPRERRWSKQLIEKFQLPARIFPKIVHPGTRLGPFSPAIEDEIGLRGTQVVASCSHDTAAAVAAVPSEGRE
jgi:rhamnulokinase